MLIHCWIFHNHLQKTCPTIKKTIFTENNNLWITPGFRKSSSTLRQVRYDLLSSNSKSFVTHYERIYGKVIRLAKRLHNNGHIEKSQNKSEAMWNIIKSQTGKSTCKAIPTGFSLSKDGETTDDPTQVIELFSSYFSDSPLSQGVVVNKITHHIPTNNSSFCLKPVSVNKIKDILSIKSKTSQGIDGIPTSIIRHCVDYISIPL